jgi:hypothetical protein
MATPTFTNLVPSGGNEGFGLDSVILVTKVLNGSAVLDPASLVDGAGENLSITVTGAVVGDFVLVAPGVDLQGIIMSASVISADTVEVRIQNETTGTIDLASSTWKAKVIQDGL